jgi:hypothetical protein
MSSGCKVNNALIVSKDAKTGAKGARVLATCVNSLTSLKAELRFNQHEGMP